MRCSVVMHNNGQSNMAARQDVTFSIDKIRKKLMELKESSSCGPDGIYPSVLKHSADVLAIPLTVIFNMSYTTSCLPSQWLTARHPNL